MDIPRGLFFFFFHLVSRENKRSTCPEIRCTGYSFHSGGWEALQKPDWLHVGTRSPQNGKGHSQKSRLAGGHCGGARALLCGALRPPRSVRRASRPGAAGLAPPAARASRRRARVAPQPRFTAAQGGGFRGRPAPGLRLQVHTGDPARGLPAPAGAPSRGPAPPPAHSSPFMRTPSAAAAAASAAAVAAAGRPDWLAAVAPALSHGPRRVRLTGGAAGAALACGQANRGARGGAGPRQSAGLCPSPASPACPPPAHSRPRLLFPPSSGDPAEPPRSRRTAAGQGPAWRAGAGFALALSLALVPPRSGRQSTERGAGLAEGRLLPGSHRPAPPPPRPPPPPLLPSPGT